mgnify:FL=1
MIYPDRDLEELYIQNQSIWEEVSEGYLRPEIALEYMQIDPNSLLWDRVLDALISANPPLP